MDNQISNLIKPTIEQTQTLEVEFTSNVNEQFQQLWAEDSTRNSIRSKIMRCTQCEYQVANKFVQPDVMSKWIDKYTPIFNNLLGGYMDLDIVINEYVSAACKRINLPLDNTIIPERIPYGVSNMNRRNMAMVEKYMYNHNVIPNEKRQDSKLGLVYHRDKPINPFMDPR